MSKSQTSGNAIQRLVDGARPAPLWHDDPDWLTVGAAATSELPTEPLDVVIIGAGFSGLWTAIWLSKIAPEWRIAIVDASGVGAGASSRNGGWCSAVMPMSPTDIAARLGTEAATQLYAEAITNVDEIGSFIRSAGIDCSWRKGGTLVNASHAAQVKGVRSEFESWRSLGFERHVRWLDPESLRSMINLAPTMGGYVQDFCASIHPARLVAGLARSVRARGVSIHAPITVQRIETGAVVTSLGHIHTRHTVRATEAFTPSIRQYRREVLPVYSLMVATEPLRADVRAALNWADGLTFTDGGELVVYAQLTGDGRLAFGGRGAHTPYASRPIDTVALSRTVHERLLRTMHDFFPATRDALVTHRWGGAVAVHRDWWPAIRIDESVSTADHRHVSIGGYVGDGVAASHLLARRAAELLAAPRSLPHTLASIPARRWEPEPMRFIGSNAMISLISFIDRRESRRLRRSRFLRRLLSAFLGA
ncbi:MAG: NAD(P)/FAD-dependent oxidoreductase [Ilumatobacteraceae bacterium]